MNYNIRMENNVLEVDLCGRFTFNDVGSFRPLIGTIEKPNVDMIIFQMKETEFVDSAALGLLILAKGEADKHKKKMVLQSPRGYVKKVLEISQFYSLFDIKE